MKVEDLATARVVVTGGPLCGSLLASAVLEALGYDVRHTDVLVGKFAWSDASLLASTWLEHPGPWVAEGVTMLRAIRKFLGRHPGTLKPCDVVMWFDVPKCELSEGQAAMLKGCATIWAQVRPELERRGVEVRVMGAEELAGTRVPATEGSGAV